MSGTFADLTLAPELTEALELIGFKQPTAIQEQVIPLLLKNKDVIGQSPTGSGKTLTFALPILQNIQLEPRAMQALILCPTRELAAQVARDMRRLAHKYKGLQILVLAGGEPVRLQREAIERGVQIIVGTPGRILDHISRGNLEMSRLKTLVLDEADRMLDMGFEKEVDEILQETPSTRQTVFFSATFPDLIKSWSRKYQHSPAHIRISIEEQRAPAIAQFVMLAENEEKRRLLLSLLKAVDSTALIFCNQKLTVSELAKDLENNGLSAAGLHGDLEQRDRDRVLAMFRNGSRRILLATDVAARGLDIADLEMVICYDVPHEAAAYTHRIGRTGRAGKSGFAISLASLTELQRLNQFSAAGGFNVELIRLEQLRKLIPTAKEPTALMQTLYISAGRKDKLRPGDVLGALTGEAGELQASDVGKIEIHDSFSYVAVSKLKAEHVAQRLSKGKIKGRRFLVKLVD